MRIYWASKCSHASEIRALRAALAPQGIHITCRWLDWKYQDLDDKAPWMWREHWVETIIPDVQAADCLVFQSMTGERACSALIELGLFLGGAGNSSLRPVLCISPDWWSFSEMANVQCCETVEQGVNILLSMQVGTQARELRKGNGGDPLLVADTHTAQKLEHTRQQ
jgi:hypothetical protein